MTGWSEAVYMLKLGFHQRWDDMMMQFITTISFAVLSNGERLENFNPSRGIRMGGNKGSQILA